MKLADLATPALILDRTRVAANCAAMIERARTLGVRLRPHMKTAKSAEVARLATAGQFGGITVSTLAEARYFAARGFRDITYSVGIVPAKLEAVAALQGEGVAIQLVTDNAAMVAALGERAAALGARFQLLIEIDSGGGRSGILPDSEDVLALGRRIAGDAHLALAGVFTHAGHSYKRQGAAAITEIAEEERSKVVAAAKRLRGSGLPCPIVSLGSTPTATFARDLSGVTEMRPGVYTLFDLFQAGIGVCAETQLAVSVLASVIGHNPRTGRALIDAGGLALSQDLSANANTPNVGYGRVADVAGRPLPDLHVAAVSQEHGQIAGPAGTTPFTALPVGARVRILPNHVCMMAAPYDRYYVVESGDIVIAEWDKCRGW
jgi:D-serine deaminase-like pyridoxal phosphate-dependent protein